MNEELSDADRVAERLRMVEMMEQIAKLPIDEGDQFVRALLLLGSCFVEKTNHGVFLLVEHESTLKVMGVNATLFETGHIVGQAAEMFITNAVANELHKRGETH